MDGPHPEVASRPPDSHFLATFPRSRAELKRGAMPPASPADANVVMSGCTVPTFWPFLTHSAQRAIISGMLDDPRASPAHANVVTPATFRPPDLRFRTDSLTIPGKTEEVGDGWHSPRPVKKACTRQISIISGMLQPESAGMCQK